MKRLGWLLLLPLSTGALFAQTQYSISGTVPNGIVGVSYSASLQTSPQAYAAWSYTGSLPPGLSMTTGSNYAATISGTPTTAGTYSFTVQASIGGLNAAPIIVRQAYTVGIAGPVTISTTTLPDGVVGVSYSQGVTATGGYGLGTYTYTLAQGTLPPGLQLNSTSGVIYGTPTAAGLSSFAMQVSSQAGGGPVLSAYAYLSINVSTPPLTITTASLPAGAVLTAYSQTLAVTGGTPPYTWRVTSGSLPGGLTLASSGNISGTPTAAGTFTIQVAVSDSQQGSASGSFTIKINSAALVVITTTSLPAGTVGTAYTATTLAATGGTPPYTWSVASGALPSALSISSGVISGTPAAVGSFTFQVTVTDSQQATATGTFTIRITAAALVITTTFLPAGTVGTAYTATTLAATGGTPPYTWSVAPGSTLPGGLSLSSAGVVSGTPSVAGTFPVTLQVTDSAQAAATRSYSIAVAAPAAPLSITTNQISVPSGQAGVAYTETFAATGGTTPYSWYITAGALPPGLNLNQSTGSVTGTPTAAGTFTFTVEVADIGDHSVFQPFTITVIAAVKITPSSLAAGITGTPYTQQFAASGGVAPYVWSVAAGSIPSGLSLSTSTGLLSGTPTTPGTYNFTIGVVDQSKQTDSVAYTIAIVAPLSITTATTLPGGVVGAAYTQTFAATGGSSPYQWSVSTGTVPIGLTLNASTGSLVGTPTAAGTFTFTIRVADAAARSATASFTIVVTAALSITTTSLPGATVGIAYNQALALAGGPAPVTWSIASGALPAGIALNPGSLNGIPSAPGTFTFTVSVTGGGQTATQSLTMTVGVPPGPLATITVPSATPSPATQPALGIAMPSAYPLAITGTVTLTFAPDSPSPDGQEVVFTTGGRPVGFTVPANTTQVVFSGATPAVQTGTVSGTITLTLKLTAAGIDVTPSSVAPTTLKIAKAAPVIKTATVSRTSTGFNLVVVGYATSREMVSATVTFTAASGVTLASSSATVSLSSVFTTWYADPTSAAYGSNFSLTMPFTLTNGTSTAPLTSVSVQLTSAQGNSNSMSANY